MFADGLLSRLNPMTTLNRGLYEVLVTESLEEQLSRLGGSLEAVRDALRAPALGADD
jgi:hypothetical protein